MPGAATKVAGQTGYSPTECTGEGSGTQTKTVQENIRTPNSPFGLSAPPNLLFP